MARTARDFAHYAPAQRETSRRLRALPNVGPAMADDLMRLGIGRVEDLIGRDGDELYEALCRLDGVRHDPCVRDVFAAAADMLCGCYYSLVSQRYEWAISALTPAE